MIGGTINTESEVVEMIREHIKQDVIPTTSRYIQRKDDIIRDLTHG